MSLQNITFSNEDQTHLQYASFSNAWFIDGTYDATNTGQSGTLSSTKDNTANVTFKFPQAANAVYYYGIRRCCGAFYAVCVDCDSDSSAGFESIDAVNLTDDGKNPPVVLWSKTFSTPGIHTVILTNQLDNRFANGNSQITVASFVLQVQDDTTSISTSTAPVTPPSSPGPSGTQSNTPLTSPTGSTSSAQTASTSASGSPAAISSAVSTSTGSTSGRSAVVVTTSISVSGSLTAVVSTVTSPVTSTPSEQTSTSGGGIPLKPFLGGLLGGLAALAAVVLAIMICCRRRRRRASATRGTGRIPGRVTTDPQMVPFTAMTPSTTISATGYVTTTMTPTSGEVAQETQEKRRGGGASDPRWQGVRPTKVRAFEANDPEERSDAPTLLPPSYDDIFRS